MQRYSLLVVGLILVLASVVSAGELKVCLDGTEQKIGPIPVAPPPAAAPGDDEATYSGTVRVFLVEPMARWTDFSGNFYSYGFLDFPIASAFSVSDGNVVYFTNTWNASTTPLAEIFPENIMAIGVVYKNAAVLTDASPPEGYYFQAHYTDAAAAATPGVIGHNDVSGPYTHPVFIEESTAST
jgi:hypothetical protein